MEKPKICSLPQAHRGVAELKRTLDSITRTDLSLDGEKDDAFMTTITTTTICGEIPLDELADQIMSEMKPPEGYPDAEWEKFTRKGNKIVGRFWRKEISVGNGVSVIKSIEVQPMPNPLGTYKLKHLGDKALRVGDPIKLVEGETLFVVKFDYSNAIRWNGKEMTVDYDRVIVIGTTASGATALLKGENPKKGDLKVFRVKGIKEVLDRKDFPEIYGPPKAQP